jgi:hypothetical protein
MKLEYQAIKLRRGDKWHCNFCSFEKERSLNATSREKIPVLGHFFGTQFKINFRGIQYQEL